MKVWKKLAGVVLALAVMMSLSVSALADNTKVITEDNEFTEVEEGYAQGSIAGTSFTVTYTDSGERSINFLPQKVINYTITTNGTNAPTDGAVKFKSTANQTDAQVTSTTNYAATVTFAPTTSDSVSATVELAFDLDAFAAKTYENSYKYVISDGTNSYDLYVYALRDANKPYAAMLVTDSTNWDEDGDNTAIKVAGYEASEDGDAQIGDFEITKTVEGNNADTSGTFALNIDIQMPAITGASNWSATYTVNKTGATFSDSNGAATTIPYSTSKLNYTATITNGGTIDFIGLPVGTKVWVTETAASSTDLGYTVTSEVTRMGTTRAEGDTAEVTAYGVVETGTLEDDAGGLITITNTRDVISPTGVVLRFAPYLAMLGAGLTTMVIAPRRKEEE